MAIEVRHSRTATLVDSGANPGYDADEIQAADWNAAHPITGDGMGLLFSNSAGAVAETMTVDMGTLTADTPLTFKQTWSDGTQAVAFRGLTFDAVVQDEFAAPQGDPANSAGLSVRFLDNADAAFSQFEVTQEQVRATTQFALYDSNFSGSPVIAMRQDAGGTILAGSIATSYAQITPDGFETQVEDSGNTWNTVYRGSGISFGASTGADFVLPISETEIATWAGAPTTSDIASGYAQVGKDTSTSNVWLAVNDGGTIKKVQLT